MFACVFLVLVRCWLWLMVVGSVACVVCWQLVADGCVLFVVCWLLVDVLFGGCWLIVDV